MSKLSAQDSGMNPNTLMHHQKLSNNNNIQMHHQQQSQHHHHHNNYYHHHKPKHLFSNNNYNYPQQQQHYQAQSKYNNNQNYSNHAKQTSSSSHQSMVATINQSSKQRIFPNSNNNGSKKLFDSDSSIITHNEIDSCNNNNNFNINNLDESSQDNFGPVIENEEEIEDNEKKSTFFNSAWLFPEEYIINNTPSRVHGISYDAEIEYRRKGTTFIRDLAKFLKVKPICKETAYVYFHRFFLLRSFKIFEPLRIAMACLYFACKYEDNPLCKDHLIQVSYLLINKPSNHQLNRDDKEYIEYCDRLISDENSLIQVLGFCFVKHFQVLILESYSQRQIPGTSKELYSAAYQIASELNRLTTLCLEYNAPTLAAVSIHLAACYKSVTLPDDWCLIMMPNLKDPSCTKELVLKISGQYREILASSQLIRKMLSDEYKRKYGAGVAMTNNKFSKNKAQMADIQKQLPQQLFSNNFSPDSAYSSSSSNAPTYSPAEKIINETAVSGSSGEIDIFNSSSNNDAMFQADKTIPSFKNSKCSMMMSPIIYKKHDASATSLLNAHEQQQSVISNDQMFRNSNKNQTVNHPKQLSSQNNVRCSSTIHIQNSVNSKYKRVAAAIDFYDNGEDQFQQINDEFNNTLTPFSHINNQSQHQEEIPMMVENYYKKFKSNSQRHQPQQLNSRNDPIFYHQHQQQAAEQHHRQSFLLKKKQQHPPTNNSNSSSAMYRGN